MDGKNKAALLLYIFLCCSCSVKEDRTGCPCRLEITFDKPSEITSPVCLSAWRTGLQDNQVLFRDMLRPDSCASVIEKTIPKGYLTINAVLGMTGNTSMTDGCLCTLPYSQADSLFCFNSDVAAFGETAGCHVSLHKEFSTVTVVFDPVPEEFGNYSFKVISGWVGLDFSENRAMAGNFEYSPVPENDRISFRVTRQGDDRMQLTVRRMNDGEYADFDIGIGEIISEMGYDWTMEDLLDINMKISLASGQVSICVGEWETGEDLKHLVL